MSFTYNSVAANAIGGTPSLRVIKWSWEGANQSEATTIEVPPGFAIEIVTVPSGSPTDNYDIAITDTTGSDILRGAGADRDTSNTERSVIRDNGVGYPSPCAGVLTFTITNQAQAGASGDVYLYIRHPEARN